MVVAGDLWRDISSSNIIHTNNLGTPSVSTHQTLGRLVFPIQSFVYVCSRNSFVAPLSISADAPLASAAVVPRRSPDVTSSELNATSLEMAARSPRRMRRHAAERRARVNVPRHSQCDWILFWCLLFLINIAYLVPLDLVGEEVDTGKVNPLSGKVQGRFISTALLASPFPRPGPASTARPTPFELGSGDPMYLQAGEGSPETPRRRIEAAKNKIVPGIQPVRCCGLRKHTLHGRLHSRRRGRIRSAPARARIAASNGRLRSDRIFPIHLACLNHMCPHQDRMVQELARRNPTALGHLASPWQDKLSFSTRLHDTDCLPIHVYHSGMDKVDLETVKLMVDLCPISLDPAGKNEIQPLHIYLKSAFEPDFRVRVVKYLLEKRPSSIRHRCSSAYCWGLPLQIACENCCISHDIIQCLADEWHEGLFQKDHRGFFPITGYVQNVPYMDNMI
ncbi:hypothetical protein THAOC_06086, partial [Thalassiosira oceanica]